MERISILGIMAWLVVAGLSAAIWRGSPSDRATGITWCAAPLGAVLAIGPLFALDHEVLEGVDGWKLFLGAIILPAVFSPLSLLLFLGGRVGSAVRSPRGARVMTVVHVVLLGLASLAVVVGAASAVRFPDPDGFRASLAKEDPTFTVRGPELSGPDAPPPVFPNMCTMTFTPRAPGAEPRARMIGPESQFSGYSQDLGCGRTEISFDTRRHIAFAHITDVYFAWDSSGSKLPTRVTDNRDVIAPPMGWLVSATLGVAFAAFGLGRARSLRAAALTGFEQPAAEPAAKDYRLPARNPIQERLDEEARIARVERAERHSSFWPALSAVALIWTCSPLVAALVMLR